MGVVEEGLRERGEREKEKCVSVCVCLVLAVIIELSQFETGQLANLATNFRDGPIVRFQKFSREHEGETPAAPLNMAA